LPDNTIDGNTSRTNLALQTAKNTESKLIEKSNYNTILGFMGSVYGEATYKRGKITDIAGVKKLL